MRAARVPPDAGLLIALDWGTSSLRAYLLGAGGAVIDRRGEPLGILGVPDRDFAGVFAAITADWRRDQPDLPAIASGMIGSRQGWIEAPYVDAPAALSAVASAVVTVPDGGLRIVPGVAQRGRFADVMRGEETQVFGVIAGRPELGRRATLVMPGTHSKWVRVADGAIERFTTYMTGELFAVLRGHSILGRLASGQKPSNDESAGDAFTRGVLHAAEAAYGLAGLLFSARSQVLIGDLRADDSLDYLSGLLIGDEVRAGLAGGEQPDAIIGEPALCARYVSALESLGVRGVPIVEDAAPAGLWDIASLALPSLQRAEG